MKPISRQLGKPLQQMGIDAGFARHFAVTDTRQTDLASYFMIAFTAVATKG